MLSSGTNVEAAKHPHLCALALNRPSESRYFNEGKGAERRGPGDSSCQKKEQDPDFPKVCSLWDLGQRGRVGRLVLFRAQGPGAS